MPERTSAGRRGPFGFVAGHGGRSASGVSRYSAYSLCSWLWRQVGLRARSESFCEFASCEHHMSAAGTGLL